MDDLEPDDELVDTPLVSPFLDSDDDSGDGEVLNELEEYGNVGKLCRKKVINSFDGHDLAFQCMIGFRKFVAYFDPFLPMNIITHKAYNTIMVDGLESTVRNLVAIVKDVYVFVGSFTYITDFVALKDIREFIVSDITDVVMGKPFRVVTQLEYDCVKDLISFTSIFDTYIYRMPHTIPRLKNFDWSKVPPIMVLSQRDLMSRLKHAHEKNKFMYKNCLNLDPEYQVDESMKEWLIPGHKEVQEVMTELIFDNMEKALTESNLSITSNDINIELNKEFLVELRKNIYHGTYNEDVVDHIAKGDGKITTWEELVEKFFCRFYTESYDGEDEMLDKGDNLMKGRNLNMKTQPDTATDSFFKSYDIRDIEENNGQGQLKCKDDNWNNKQPNKKVCKTEMFEAMKYSLGLNKEYIAVRRCEYNTWERNDDSVSQIYQEIF
ncbi:hypothetical protein Tco_0718777 [Tanacetum coccineum]